MKQPIIAKSVLVVLMGILALSSCKPKPNPPKPDPEKKEKAKEEVKTVTINATDYTKWVYFNFEKGEVVEVAKPGEDLSWDLGVHRYDFKTNGGTSGKGQGAAFKSKVKDISLAIPAPAADAWVVDSTWPLLMVFENQGNGKHIIEYREESANFLLTSKTEEQGLVLVSRGAIWSEGMPPQVTVNNAIYLIRTANGKLVRFRVLDYRNDRAQTGHIKFEYVVAQQ